VITVLNKSDLKLKKCLVTMPRSSTVHLLSTMWQARYFLKAIDGSGVKVLGLQWWPTEDVFSCALRCESPPFLTKRDVLSLIASIFDPLGIFSPAIFYANTHNAADVVELPWLGRQAAEPYYAGVGHVRRFTGLPSFCTWLSSVVRLIRDCWLISCVCHRV
jgi:hypothetical protein